ncbi:MAG TPA: SET domain-containing protein-lysine N-methyltransferase [Planctomycetota bacterium]|nr:SET domain-containing protein-lysine N-methyltransferase [Planctomycetota bacterium]
MAEKQHAPLLDEAPSAPDGLRVIESNGRGRGLVAARAFRRGEVIERAPVIVVARKLLQTQRGSVLDDYWFWWDDEHNAFALGWAALYNHACPANTRFRVERAVRLIVFEAAADIEAGDEVTINYHGEPDDPSPVWFPAR